MHLLVDGVAGDRVGADRAALWLGEIYSQVYGCRGDDPRRLFE